MMTINDILKLDSGLYTADVDGKPAIIGRDVGKGFTIRMTSKEGWDLINHYNEEGQFEGTTFERSADKEISNER